MIQIVQFKLQEDKLDSLILGLKIFTNRLCSMIVIDFNNNFVNQSGFSPSAASTFHLVCSLSKSILGTVRGPNLLRLSSK